MKWPVVSIVVAILVQFPQVVFGVEFLPSSKQQVIERLTYSPYIIRGMHDTLGGEQAEGFDMVTKQCGTSPSLWSGDFGFSTHPNDSIRLRAGLLAKARKMHSQGVLITLSWHQCNPIQDEPCTFEDGVQKVLDESEWKELLKDGSPLNVRWKVQMDRLAAYLKLLQNEDIPVLLRPYHEANIPGFWWAHSNATYSKALWSQLRSYYTNHHGLMNLIWVWSVSFHPKYWARVSEYYPGDEMVDVIGVDIYPPTKDGIPDFARVWTTLKSLAPTKPIALSEVSRLPSQSEINVRKWAYVVPWGENMLFRDNSQAEICNLYQATTPPTAPQSLWIK